MPVQTRRQLATDPEMCMFVLTDELHQFDRLKVWELVDKLKWLWKNKKDEDQTVIRNKARLVAKGYVKGKGGIDFEDHLHQLSLGSFRIFCCLTSHIKGSLLGGSSRKSSTLTEESFVLLGLKQAPRSLIGGETRRPIDYRSKIRSSLYLNLVDKTSVKQYGIVQFYQALGPNQKSTFKDVKRIFKYLKGFHSLGTLSTWRLSAKLLLKDVDKDTASRLCFNKLQNKLYWRSLSQPCNVHANIVNIQGHRTSILAEMFTKAFSVEIRGLSILSDRLGMRCLTPADLEGSDK
ncbi:hypothetical protein Tco_0198954 [Tanacetum coccineum]